MHLNIADTSACSSEGVVDDLPMRRSPEDRMISLFGLNITDTTIDNAAGWIVRRAQGAAPIQVSFLNADCVNVMHRDPKYQEALQQSDRIFADGIGVRLAARMAGHSLRDNVNGTDLFPVLCAHAARSGVGVFLFGAREGRARKAGEKMRQAIPGLTISGCHHGYVKDARAEAEVIDAINNSGAGIVLVALGAPSQELWIARNRHKLRPAVVVGVGGLFDYYSGSVARAPLVVRKLSLEWVWRLAMEPRRLARRYIIGNVEFLMRIGFGAGLHGGMQSAD